MALHSARLLLVTLLIAVPLRAQQAPPPQASTPASAREVRNIPYVTGGHERQRLDIYLPSDSAPKHPLLVWVHGGGWQAGSKDGCPAKAMISQGYVVASIGYRLSQHAIFPAQIEDCKAAIRWLRAHAGEYGIDPAHVGAWGASAGGHLVALLGTTGHAKDFDVGENLDQSSAVQCVIDSFGPADFLHWGEPPSAKLDDPKSAPAKLIGGPISTHQDAARRASPVYHVTAEAAPFLILQGDHDPLVPLQQSQELDAALRKAGVESTLKIIAGGGHGGAGFNTPDVVHDMKEFCDRHLKPGAAK